MYEYYHLRRCNGTTQEVYAPDVSEPYQQPVDIDPKERYKQFVEYCEANRDEYDYCMRNRRKKYASGMEMWVYFWKK